MAGFDRKRFARLFLVVAALALALYFGQRWPREQTIHYVLGDGAARVEQVDAKWAEGHTIEREHWAREVSYRYAPGQAPRVITYEPKLPDGDYTVEVEIVAANDAPASAPAAGPGAPAPADRQGGTATTIVRRQLKLGGGVTQIDLAPSVPR